MEVTFEAELKDETDLAYIFVIYPEGFDDKEASYTQSVPKSVCEWEPSTDDEVRGEVHIKNWFVRKEGMV